MTNKVYIYTDDACKGNPGPGGWGALMRFFTDIYDAFYDFVKARDS